MALQIGIALIVISWPISQLKDLCMGSISWPRKKGEKAIPNDQVLMKRSESRQLRLLQKGFYLKGRFDQGLTWIKY